jgi:hypothetical protein
MDLPQISPKHKEILDEEITPDEVEEAINETHEISAPGPSGQTTMIYKLIFQELSTSSQLPSTSLSVTLNEPATAGCVPDQVS